MGEVDRNAPTVTAGADRRVEDAPAASELGRYRVDGELGRGGMGVVYRGHDPDLDRPVAIKVLRRGQREARLLEEGKAVARLRHPNVITVHDVGVHGDELFIAMELVDGGTLREWLAERPRSVGEILDVYAAAGRGLAAAHAAGLVHRDFKPDNVLVGRDGRVVVGDFGLAQEGGAAPSPAGGAIVDITTAGLAGTPAYMAPEQLRGERADSRADQFAFCVALWEALYRERPFMSDGPVTFEALAAAVQRGQPREPQVRRGVPRRVHAALRRGLSARSGDRFPTLPALLAAIAPGRTGRVVLAVAAVVVAAAAATVAWLAARPAGDAAFTRDPSADVAARRAEVAAAWTPTARDAYLASAPDAADAADDVRWFDAYAHELGARLAIATVVDAAHPRGHAGAVLGCLRGAVDDLRAAVVRPEREYWPALRRLATCGDVQPELRTVIAAATGSYRLAANGRTLASGAYGAALAIVPGDGSPPRFPSAGTTPLRWLADGSLAAVDDRGQLVVVTADGRAGAPIDLAGSVVEVSPAGDLAAVVDARGLWIRRTGGPAGDGDFVDARVTAEPEQSTFRFSPDGRSFAAVASDAQAAWIVVVELASHRRTEIRLRVGGGMVGLTSLAWTDDRTLLTSGTLGDVATDGYVFRLNLTDAGRLAGPPEEVLHAPVDVMYVVESVVSGTALALEVRAVRSFARVHRGLLEPVPLALSGAWPRDIDALHGRALIDSVATGPVWLDLGSHVTTPAILGGLSPVVLRWAQSFRDGIAGGLVDDRGDVVATAEIDGAGHVEQVPWPVPTHLKRLRCGTGRCYFARADGDDVVVGRADPTGPVELRRLPSGSGLADFDVSDDESRFAVATFTGLRFIDQRSGSVLAIDRSVGCDQLQLVRFVPGTHDQLVAACRKDAPTAFVLVQVRDRTMRTWYTSSGWFDAIAPVDPDTTLVSTVTHQWTLREVPID